jgi:N utilization substance protein B
MSKSATEKRLPARPRRDARHRGREAAVQMLYQWEIGGGAVASVVDAFWTQTPVEDTEAPAAAPPAPRIQAFAGRLAEGVAGSVERLDPLLSDAAQHWRLERMATIDRIILRLAVWEFLHEPDTPARVIINEALELARTFSTDEAVRFINGMLDGIRRTLERE